MIYSTSTTINGKFRQCTLDACGFTPIRPSGDRTRSCYSPSITAAYGGDSLGEALAIHLAQSAQSDPDLTQSDPGPEVGPVVGPVDGVATVSPDLPSANVHEEDGDNRVGCIPGSPPTGSSPGEEPG